MKSWSDVYLPPIDSRFVFPMLSLHNAASNSAVTLPNKAEYSMYVCGITPYDATHLGHAATYITFDLVNRYLTAMGKKVNFVENVTDIDDPLLERAHRDGVDWEDLAHSQIDLFRGDMADLHVIPPQSYIGAVEAIPLIIDSIQSLQEADTVYPVDGDLYFSVNSDEKFGSRSHLSQEKMVEIFSERGGDPKRVGKKQPLDALVWQLQRPGEPAWPSPFGAGRPGWHIECCAIALAYLPLNDSSEFMIDIQGGGSDLLFPHHEMGAAQSRILGKRDYARIYMYAGMIGLDGEKMSKSKGNLLFVSRMIMQGCDPMAIRLALLSDRYADDRMWQVELLTQANDLLAKLRLLLSRPEVAPTDPVIQKMIIALSDNLDTPSVFRALEEWCSATEMVTTGDELGSPGELARALDLLLGIAI